MADQGCKSLFALYAKCKSLSVNCKTMSGLFDIYVSSILYYSCEVWGLNKGTEVEKLHLEFCKRLLGVKKSTCNIVVYFELGRIPLEYMRLFHIIKY